MLFFLSQASLEIVAGMPRRSMGNHSGHPSLNEFKAVLHACPQTSYETYSPLFLSSGSPNPVEAQPHSSATWIIVRIGIYASA